MVLGRRVQHELRKATGNEGAGRLRCRHVCKHEVAKERGRRVHAFEGRPRKRGEVHGSAERLGKSVWGCL